MSRFQAPIVEKTSENPNLQPRRAQVDPWANRGRFQQVDLGPSSAEERTRLSPGITWENRLSVPKSQQTTTTTTTHDDANKPKVVHEEETTTTVIEDDA